MGEYIPREQKAALPNFWQRQEEPQRKYKAENEPRNALLPPEIEPARQAYYIIKAAALQEGRTRTMKIEIDNTKNPNDKEALETALTNEVAENYMGVLIRRLAEIVLTKEELEEVKKQCEEQRKKGECKQ